MYVFATWRGVDGIFSEFVGLHGTIYLSVYGPRWLSVCICCLCFVLSRCPRNMLTFLAVVSLPTHLLNTAAERRGQSGPGRKAELGLAGLGKGPAGKHTGRCKSGNGESSREKSSIIWKTWWGILSQYFSNFNVKFPSDLGDLDSAGLGELSDSDTVAGPGTMFWVARSEGRKRDSTWSFG